MTFDLDTTTLDIDVSSLDGLIQELQNQASLLVTVATGGLRIQATEAEHQRRRQRLIPALEHHNLKYPFPWHDLWLWHGYWSENLPNYASRRAYIHQLVSPVLDALEHQQSNLTVANPQSQENIAVAMPEQRATRAAEQQEVVSSTGSNKCAGTTKSGNQCQAKPGASGYCPTHDPALIEKKRLELEAQEAARQQRELQKKPLQDIISKIEATCRVRGWETRVKHFDNETAKHAEVEASKQISMLNLSGTTIEIDLNKDNQPKLTFRTDLLYSEEGVDKLKHEIYQGLNTQVESPVTPKEGQTQTLGKIVNRIRKTCKAKGWNCATRTLDRDAGVYATLSLSHLLDLGGEVLASIEIEHREDGTTMNFQQNPLSTSSHGIKSLNQAITRDLEALLGKPLSSHTSQQEPEPAEPNDALLKVRSILKNFHRAAKQLETRHDQRGAIIIRDEYDVQDILRSFLHISFEDIRPEDYVPSYAGARSRVDFLLREEKIVIEVKMTRDTLRDREIGEQLSIDIQRYQGHSRCSTLLCFVYDPGGFLKNPKSLINDLNGKHRGINVEVIIYHP